MNSEREWVTSCLHGQQDIWAEWVRIGERLADTQEVAGWGTPYALRLLNEQNARWLEATQHWLREWERIAHAYPALGYGERQALLRNRIFQTWLDTVSGLDWDQWHQSMRQAFLLLQQAFQAAQAAQTAPAALAAAASAAPAVAEAGPETGPDAGADRPAALAAASPTAPADAQAGPQADPAAGAEPPAADIASKARVA